MGEWSELPVELLMMIHQHFSLDVDKIRFRCVCAHWQSSSELPDLVRRQPPWLVLPFKCGSFCGVYHPLARKVYEMDFSGVSSHLVNNDIFKGSGHGWVVAVHDDGTITALNPLSRARVPLPPHSKLPDKPPLMNYDISKIVVSCAPDFIAAVAIYGGFSNKLAYCKAGGRRWRNVIETHGNRYRHYKDVTFTAGKLFALTREGEVMICEDITSCPKLRMLMPVPLYVDFSYCNVRLINSSVDPSERFAARDSTIFKLDNNRSISTFFKGLSTQLGISSQTFQGRDGNQIYLISDQLTCDYDDMLLHILKSPILSSEASISLVCESVIHK